ncbi:lanthionine synthetase C family protein [Fluviispira vulneris]|uniref:lanthionine synthetase C family protein n=1 Tax=Fluviispira vulneris TaxID=2763012 RepID=UPI001648B10D|nr:lanthionine synthetase C family protein [Fluviispira vulneris]
MFHEIITEISKRFEDISYIENNTKNFFTDKLSFNHTSLAEGFPAIALFYAQLNLIEPNARMKKLIHLYLEKTISYFQNKNIASNSSIFSGISGLNFVVWMSSEEGKLYQGLLSKIDAVLFYMLDQQLKNIAQKTLLSPMDYDPIQGLSGVVRYLILRKNDRKNYYYLQKCLEILIQLSSYKEIDGNYIPAWYFENENTQSEKNWYDGFHKSFNLGFSHGISGVLAALSLAKINSIDIKGLDQAILNIKNWLLKWTLKDTWGDYWPSMITLEEELQGEISLKQERGERQAWCYGTPGISRAIYLAGQALNDHELKNFALKSFLAIEQRPEETWRCNSPTFCHGYAGLLQIAKRFYFDTKEPKLVPLISRLEQRVMHFYSQGSPYLFKAESKNGKLSGDLGEIGIIEGTVGAVLCLLHTDHFSHCIWDYPFLIS